MPDGKALCAPTPAPTALHNAGATAGAPVRFARPNRREVLECGGCACSLHASGGREERASGSPSPPLEETGVWPFWMGQPGGLPEGSRRSPGVWGRRPPDNSAGDFMHPGRGARLVAAATRAGDGLAGKGWVGHPSGVLRHPTRFSGGRSPLCPGRPPATICQTLRVDRSKVSKLQPPASVGAIYGAVRTPRSANDRGRIVSLPGLSPQTKLPGHHIVALAEFLDRAWEGPGHQERVHLRIIQSERLFST